MKVEATVTHTRTFVASVSRHDLRGMVLLDIAASQGLDPTEVLAAYHRPQDPKNRYRVEVKEVEETEGSPSYKVGTGLRVIITENLS
jgi:hypothetical protein